MFANRFARSFIMCLVLALAGCASNSLSPSGTPPSGTGLPSLSDLDGSGIHSQSAIGDDPITVAGDAEIFDFNGTDNPDDHSLTLFGNGEGPDSPDQLAWAVYQISGLDETSDAQSITVSATAHGEHGSYYVGLSNYSHGHWTWHGPFHDAEATIDLSHDGDRYISHEGNMYFNITTYHGVVTHHHSVLSFGHNGHDTHPGVPVHLAATDGEFEDHVYLHWEGGAGATSFEVWRAIHGDHQEFTQIGTTDAHEFTDSDVDLGVVYVYKVRAVNDSGSSDFSSSDGGYAAMHHEDHEGCPSELAASDGLHFVGVALNWLGDHTLTYDIYRKVDGGDGDYEVIGHAQGLEYFDSTAVYGHIYLYKIGYVLPDGSVCFSNEDHGSVGGDPQH